MIESALLLFLVIDPFGNLPFVLSIIGDTPTSQYRRIILRETSLAFLTLLLFSIAGDQLLSYLDIEQPTVSVAGGVILFLISLKMIFRTSAEMPDDSYHEDPLLVPIAIPSLAGPSAITTVMILRLDDRTDIKTLLLSLCIVMLATAVIFLIGRHISVYLGKRGLRAMETLAGLLLNLVAVNMMLVGIGNFIMAYSE